MESLFTVHLKIVLVFAVLTIAPLILESLLGNTPVTMTILQSEWAPFHHKLAQYRYH